MKRREGKRERKGIRELRESGGNSAFAWAGVGGKLGTKVSTHGKLRGELRPVHLP